MYPNPMTPYQPYGMQFQQRMQPFSSVMDASPRDLIRVTGMEGAKAYQMPPNSRAALFDDADDVVFIKMTDGAGFPSYKRARLIWEDEPKQAAPNTDEFVTRKEFEDLKELIMNAKQSVRKQSKAAAEPEE